MVLGVSEDHRALHDAVRRWVADRCPPVVGRTAGEADVEGLPPFWSELATQGWLGVHLPSEHGGAGAGLPELAVVIEELGRALAPGPFLPTVLAGALIAESGAAGAAELLPGIASGSVVATVALPGSDGLVLGAGLADVVVLPAAPGRWVVVDRADLDVEPRASLDPTRRVARVRLHDRAAHRALPGLRDEQVADLAVTLFAAEASGIAAWCLDTAVEHAKVREQFGRPIGQFQAIKHRCADMLVGVEQARAAAWDAARAAADPTQRPLAAAVAGAIALEAACSAAKDLIQILGGIGFTWEHDAHWYLRRATAVRQLTGGSAAWRRRAAAHALGGVRRDLDLELPSEPDGLRDEVRSLAASLDGLDPAEQRKRLADGGWLAPHWPAPWGRGAGAVEQLVIDEELRRAGTTRPGLQVGAWVVPTLIAHGSAEQQERWIPGTLRGELYWCQMFSEPGAGSDLASLSTKAVRTDGGWLLTGQKVWTSLAKHAHYGICLARTNPGAPKRDGITYFVVDMAADGVDIRPLRELTGHAMFNEVFLSDAFVPDENVVGEVDGGWRVAKSTLDNERVAMSSGSSFGGGVEALLAATAGSPAAEDPGVAERLGGLVADGQSLSLLGFRSTLRTLSGVEPGPAASVRKLLGVEHEQRVAELGLELRGPGGAAMDGDEAHWGNAFLANRCLTIAGGTSEVQRNVIGERLLGLPRDPEPGDRS